MRNIVKEKAGPKGEWMSDTPLKSFELFCDDAVITEIVTWTNQKIENVKTSYTSKPGFLYNKSVTNSRTDGHPAVLGHYKELQRKYCKHLGERWHWQANLHSSDESEAFLFLVYCLRFDDSTTRAQRRADDKLAPVRNIHDKFVVACEANYTPGTGCTVDESLHGLRGKM